MAGTVLQKSWFRPSLMIFTNAQPTASVASVGSWNIGSVAGTDYLFLTDDGRSDLQVSTERIEYKKRMINGRMRSYHVADKKSFSVSWKDLPSRSSGVSETKNNPSSAWAGGKEMLDWHETHPDSFYLMLVYDVVTPEKESTGVEANIPLKYRVETYNVFFQDLGFTITTRGSLYDHWDLNMSLVEV